VVGAYALLLDFARSIPLPPRFGDLELLRGRYCYVGSARGPGGIRTRCRRHLNGAERRRWHVDWLTAAAADRLAMGFPSESRCELLRRLPGVEGISLAVEGFGSSDCARCGSHLVAANRHGRGALSACLAKLRLGLVQRLLPSTTQPAEATARHSRSLRPIAPRPCDFC
jgi:Uri superfamily endonuclease